MNARLAGMLVAVANGWAAAESERSTLEWPVGEVRTVHTDSGWRANPTTVPSTIYTHVVSVDDASWLRLHFGEIELGHGSLIRITSTLDHEVQELDARKLAAWHGTSAYFNGDTAIVELVAGPLTPRNRLTIDGIELAGTQAQVAGGPCDPATCGFCGFRDDRVPSDELWTCRLLPAGCTAVVYNEDSCMLTAGHCAVGGAFVVEFNVPLSNANCSINHPPVEDQFPIVAMAFENNGPGDDWAVLRPGSNCLGQTPFERYGDLRPIASSPGSPGQTAHVTGYGVHCTCELSLTQLTDAGPICEVRPDRYLFEADISGGASGSALMLDDKIIGVVTHCPCCNVATRVDQPNFAAALAAGCVAACPWDLDFDGVVSTSDLLALLALWLTDPGGPPDFDGDGTVGTTDLLTLLAEWGPCP